MVPALLVNNRTLSPAPPRPSRSQPMYASAPPCPLFQSVTIRIRNFTFRALQAHECARIRRAESAHTSSPALNASFFTSNAVIFSTLLLSAPNKYPRTSPMTLRMTPPTMTG
jgi:hypothetical protein